jgi:hypothetical protein
MKKKYDHRGRKYTYADSAELYLKKLKNPVAHISTIINGRYYHKRNDKMFYMAFYTSLKRDLRFSVEKGCVHLL